MVKKSRLQVYLKAYRFNQGEMTQQRLADLVGVSRQTIISIEKQKYTPSVELALRIAKVFGKPVEEIFRLSSEVADEERSKRHY